MKFVHSGVKMFVKQDAQGSDTCRWRIQTEGLPIIEGWVGEGARPPAVQEEHAAIPVARDVPQNVGRRSRGDPRAGAGHEHGVLGAPRRAQRGRRRV